MTHHPLAGVIEKLRNADAHLHRLYGETLAYLNNGSNAAIWPEQDASDHTRGRLVFRVLRQPPLGIAAIAGDIVHNLRSPLDYLVEELVNSAEMCPLFNINSRSAPNQHDSAKPAKPENWMGSPSERSA
jgi:hypothetical protein